jgi:hypothetical protein
LGTIQIQFQRQYRCKMAWTYNSLRLYVQNEDHSGSQIVARLQPIGASTNIQIFGDEALIYKIDAIVVGEANLATLESMLNDGAEYELVGNDFSAKNLVLSKLSARRRNTMYQTIDTLQSCYAPVYDVSMELMLDGS